MAILSYPLENDPAYSARIRFTNYQVKALNPNSSSALREGLSGALRDNIGKFENFWESFKSTDTTIPERPEEAQARRVAKEKSDRKIKEGTEQFVAGVGKILTGDDSSLQRNRKVPMVNMFVPIAITYGDTISYGPADLGAGAAALGRALQAGEGNASAIFQGIAEGTVSALDTVFSGTQNLAEDGARLAASRMIQSVPGVKSALGNAAAFGFQVSVNPNTRALFQGVGLREFTFSFNMIATSQRESEQIEKIVRHFRTMMYPDIFDPFADEQSTVSIPFAYKFPDLFKIEFKLGNSTLKIPQIRHCYLRNAQIAYNPTGATFHRDGRPNEVQMTLNFMEFKALSKADIAEGF